MGQRIKSYKIAVLGLPVEVKASSYEFARLKVLRRWLYNLSLLSQDLPVVPTLILLDTDDEKAVPFLHDKRLSRVDTERPIAQVIFLPNEAET